MSTRILALTGPVLNFTGADSYLSGFDEGLQLSYDTPFNISLRLFPRRGGQSQFIVHIKGPKPKNGEFHVNFVMTKDNQPAFQLCAHDIKCIGVTGDAIALDTQHDVEMSSDGNGLLTLVVDGETYTNSGSLSPRSAATGEFTLGRHAVKKNQDFDGEIQDLQIST